MWWLWFALQGRNMQVTRNCREVKPWWRLKVWAGWRLIADVLLLLFLFYVKRGWSLCEAALNCFIKSVTPPAAHLSLHAALLADSSHTWSFWGGRLTFSNVVLCMSLVTLIFICVDIWNKLIFLRITDISTGYNECCGGFMSLLITVGFIPVALQLKLWY